MKKSGRWMRGLVGMLWLFPMWSWGSLVPGEKEESGYRDSAEVTARWFGEPEVELGTPGSVESRWTKVWESYRFLEELASMREGLKVKEVGESLLGAPVRALFHEGGEGALTVLVQARVHGNEPATTEGVLELARELAAGELRELPINVILIPVLNPEGAREMARRTGTDIDGNRDYVLQNSAIVRTVYRLMKAYDPEVVVDMHEHGSLEWPYDLMAIEPNHPNIPAGARKVTAERIIGAIAKAYEEAGLRFGPYRLVDRHDGGIRVRESATTFVSEKNAIALGGRINLLTEGRGIGLGTQHFKRRTLAQYTAARAILEAAARHETEIRETVDKARKEITLGAKEWILRVEPERVPARHAFLHEEKLELVEYETTYWDRTNGTVTSTVEVPRAYVVHASESVLLDRLDRFGLKMEMLTEPTELEVEKLVVEAFRQGDGSLYGGRLDRPDGAPVRPAVVRNHDIKVRAEKETVVFPAGSRVIATGQPMGLYLISLEPASYSSFAALSFWGESLPEGFEFPVYRLR